MLSGKSLPINFSSYNHTNQATNGDKDFSCHIHRALTRLKSVFVTLFREDATSSNMPPGLRKVCNDFYHPAGAGVEDLEKGQHQLQLQIGSKLTPEYPIKDSTEFSIIFARLLAPLLVFIVAGIIQLNILLDWIWRYQWCRIQWYEHESRRFDHSKL